VGRSRLQRDLPGSHEYLLVGQDCANLGRVPPARRPTGTGHQTPAWPVRRLAQSWARGLTGPISGATVVSQGLLCLGGPCAGLQHSRLAQSGPAGVLSSAFVVAKTLQLSSKFLVALDISSSLTKPLTWYTIDRVGFRVEIQTTSRLTPGKRRIFTAMNYSDPTFLIFAGCVVAFFVGIIWLIESYRDAKYKEYFFLREEAALRVKRLLFVLVPLAVIIAFLGLQLFGEKEPVGPSTPETPVVAETPGTVEAVASPTSPAAVATTPVVETATAETTATVPAVLPETVAPTVTVSATATSAVTPSETVPFTATATLAPTATLTETATLSPALTGTPTRAVSAGAPVTGTATVTATAGPALTPTVTDTPSFSSVTPDPASRIEPIEFGRAIGERNRPVNPGTVFEPGEEYVYASFAYSNMTDGSIWRYVWFSGSEELLATNDLWQWGDFGRAYIFFAPLGGFKPGRYKLQLYVGDELKQSASFVIRGDTTITNTASITAGLAMTLETQLPLTLTVPITTTGAEQTATSVAAETPSQ